MRRPELASRSLSRLQYSVIIHAGCNRARYSANITNSSHAHPQNTVQARYIGNPVGIIYMESRFKNGFSDVLGYIEKIKSILLW